MSSTPSPPLPWFFAFLPTPHPQTNNDGVIALLVALHLCIAALITPCTPGWKLFRAGIIVPVAMYLYWYCAWSALKPNHEEHWGVAAGCCWSIVRALELLVLYPAEENVYRVTPQADGDFVREPIPPPWTKAKLYWAYSLWWSNRGIGWNYSCTLPPSSTRHPFSRTSSRKAFLLNRGRHYILWIAFVDLVRAYMALGPGAAFFDGRPGVAPSYDSLSMVEKAVYSLCVCVRIMWSIEKTFTGGSLLLVAMGGVLGWEGEMWSPWGYPPLFGSIQELWLHPGLATVWSRTWHQLYRRWLYVFGWLTIGEKLLGLPHSGQSARPPPPHVTPSGAITPTGENADSSSSKVNSAGRASPTHLLPTDPLSSSKISKSSVGTRSSNRSTAMLSNFIKSLIVFALCGWMHDQASYALLHRIASPGDKVNWVDALGTIPFFVAQPFAIAVETFIKRQWRKVKSRQYPGGTPDWLVFWERLVGFAATWWWLGWSARWFVVGLTRAGVWRMGEDELPSWTLFGGLIWGKWEV
ncbi:hypothetical protein JCM24511_07829 [Saitozyma sp. JCM 24511]|nr:hypothetical protein JCM24511_07829 [Saitozyma sp. JCM 24511]